jgi:PTH1 family peptidyl-tRNA hydrolase
VADVVPWLLVGLGNPGSEYAGHRHNVGAMVVERWVDRHGVAGAPWREKFKARTQTVSVGADRVVALLPQTYMNRSGGSVGPAAAFFHVPPPKIIVVHDEIDFVLGRIAIKHGGGHGGHNGLRDLVASLPSADFLRIRVGVGRPTRGEVADWVLSDFAANERSTELPDMIERAESAITAIVRDGLAVAMNAINTKP